LPRAEDPQALALERVDDAQHQRLLGTDDRQPNPLAPGELDQPACVVRLDRNVLDVQRGPRVARGAVDRLDARRLLQLPAEGVLPPSLADDQDFQGPTPEAVRFAVIPLANDYFIGGRLIRTGPKSRSTGPPLGAVLRPRHLRDRRSPGAADG